MAPDVQREFFEQVYDILVQYAKAQPDNKASFVAYYMKENGTEWRFCGCLGFGGKFWRNAGKFYVSCYREDETKRTLKVIEKVNREIATLLAAKLFAAGMVPIQ